MSGTPMRVMAKCGECGGSGRSLQSDANGNWPDCMDCDGTGRLPTVAKLREMEADLKVTGADRDCLLAVLMDMWDDFQEAGGPERSIAGYLERGRAISEGKTPPNWADLNAKGGAR